MARIKTILLTLHGCMFLYIIIVVNLINNNNNWNNNNNCNNYIHICVLSFLSKDSFLPHLGYTIKLLNLIEFKWLNIILILIITILLMFINIIIIFILSAHYYCYCYYYWITIILLLYRCLTGARLACFHTMRIRSLENFSLRKKLFKNVL